MLKSLFSKLFESEGERALKGVGGKSKVIKPPSTFSSKFDILQYANFSLPDLQFVRLSVDAGQQEKAFEQFFHYIKTRQTLTGNLIIRDEIIHMLKEQYPDTVPTLLEAADKLLRHQFLLFSKHNIQAAPSIAWNVNYAQEGAPSSPIWESGKLYSRSQLLAETQADIHFVWDFNRHQHFLDLGKAYWCTGDHEFVREFITEISGWIEQNPYQRSVNWVEPYEIALRGMFWILGCMFFLSADEVDEEFFCHFYQTLVLHGHAVYELLQTTISKLAPHHIIACTIFLHILGSGFPEYIHSKFWSKFSWEILQWKTKILTLEQIVQSSPASLVNIVELYCLVLIIRRNNRYHIPHTIIDGMTTMLNQLSLFVKPDGHLTGIGEHHPVQLLRGMYSQSEDFQYLFAMAAVLLKKEEFKSLGRRFEEPLLWLLGSEGRQDFEKLEGKQAPQESYLAPNGSYAVMRSGWGEDSGYCIVANDTLMDKQNSPFKHSDLLSVEVFANGHEILVDAGPYSFQENDMWNQYFRSTAAHNSITVDRIKFIDLLENSPRCELDQWVSTAEFDFLSGYHAGYEELEEAVTHRRSIFYKKPNYWILCDLLTGEGQHLFDQYFHFAPLRVNVDFANKGVNVKIDKYRNFALVPIGSDDMDVMIFNGGDTPDSGWISDGYKHQSKAPLIKYGRQARVPTGFYTLLYAYKAEELLKVSGEHLRVFSQEVPLLLDEVSAMKLTVGHETHYVVLVYKRSGNVQFEDITFCGSLLFLRKQEERVLEIILHDATFLKMGDCLLFQSETPVEGFSLQVLGEEARVSCLGTYTFRTRLPQIQDVFVNERKISFRREDDTIVATTSRI